MNWTELTKANWHKAATELKQAGWQQWPDQWTGAFFTRNDECVVLRRQLGSANWYVVDYCQPEQTSEMTK